MARANQKKKSLQSAPIPESPKEYLLPRYRCIVRVDREELQLCRLGRNGEPLATRSGYGWEAVKHPVSQEFLDEVNGLMETRYTERDFQLAAYQAKSRSPSFYL